eukprot:364197-Chlamydomonas_euryale.AAC.16
MRGRVGEGCNDMVVTMHCAAGLHLSLSQLFADAHGRRQVAVLPAAGCHMPWHHRGGVPAAVAHAGPGWMDAASWSGVGGTVGR